MVCGAGVKAARSGSDATGMLARLPNNGKAWSRPQYDMANCGLIKTMSATGISPCSIPFGGLGRGNHPVEFFPGPLNEMAATYSHMDAECQGKPRKKRKRLHKSQMLIGAAG